MNLQNHVSRTSSKNMNLKKHKPCSSNLKTLLQINLTGALPSFRPNVTNLLAAASRRPTSATSSWPAPPLRLRLRRPQARRDLLPHRVRRPTLNARPCRQLPGPQPDAVADVGAGASARVPGRQDSVPAVRRFA
jgi:hypothetical protein